MGCFPFIKCWLIFSGRKVNTGLYSPVACRKLAFLGLGAETANARMSGLNYWISSISFTFLHLVFCCLFFFRVVVIVKIRCLSQSGKTLNGEKRPHYFSWISRVFFSLDANQENTLISRETEVSMVRRTSSQSQMFHNRVWLRLRWWDGKIKATPLIHM